MGANKRWWVVVLALIGILLVVSIWQISILARGKMSMRSSLEARGLSYITQLSEAQLDHKEQRGQYGELNDLNIRGLDISRGEEITVFGEYELEVSLNDTSDSFCIYLTPIDYEWFPANLWATGSHTGLNRLSYYVDESMLVRGADLGGKPANSSNRVIATFSLDCWSKRRESLSLDVVDCCRYEPLPR